MMPQTLAQLWPEIKKLLFYELPLWPDIRNLLFYYLFLSFIGYMIMPAARWCNLPENGEITNWMRWLYCVITYSYTHTYVHTHMYICAPTYWIIYFMIYFCNSIGYMIISAAIGGVICQKMEKLQTELDDYIVIHWYTHTYAHTHVYIGAFNISKHRNTSYESFPQICV